MTHQKEKRMRKVLIAAGVVSIVSMAVAQRLEVSVDGGYGFGAGTALVGNNVEYDQNWNRVKYEQVYASGGKGTKIMGEVAFFPFENVGIIVMSGYSMEETYSTQFKDISGSITMKGTISYLPINIGLKFRTKMEVIGIRVVPYTYVAPGIYLPKKTVDTITPTYTSNLTYTYGIGFGVSAGIGAEVMLPFLSDRFGIKVEFAPTYAFANPTKYTETVPNRHKTTYTYKNDTPPEQLATGEIPDQPHDSFCSMAVRAGVCIKLF
jgi:hypothetical protein